MEAVSQCLRGDRGFEKRGFRMRKISEPCMPAFTDRTTFVSSTVQSSGQVLIRGAPLYIEGLQVVRKLFAILTK